MNDRWMGPSVSSSAYQTNHPSHFAKRRSQSVPLFRSNAAHEAAKPSSQQHLKNSIRTIISSESSVAAGQQRPASGIVDNVHQRRDRIRPWARSLRKPSFTFTHSSMNQSQQQQLECPMEGGGMEGRKKGQQILSRMGVRAVVIDLVFHLFSRWDFWFPPSRTSLPSLLPYQGSEKNSFICSHEAPLYLQLLLLLLLLQFGDLERGRKAYYRRGWQNRHGRCSALLLPAVACYYCSTRSALLFHLLPFLHSFFSPSCFCETPVEARGFMFSFLEYSRRLEQDEPRKLPAAIFACSSERLFVQYTLISIRHFVARRSRGGTAPAGQTYIHTYIILSKDIALDRHDFLHLRTHVHSSIARACADSLLSAGICTRTRPSRRRRAWPS